MRCRKCNGEIENGFDWSKGSETGVETGICKGCWTAGIDGITNAIRNSKGGPLPALLVLKFCRLGDKRRAQIENGRKVTPREIAVAKRRANESGYLDRVSKYTLEIPR